jgi:hypothetical protein
MKIGIIIVTFNSQKDIARPLESIILQRYDDLIVYIVDNNSNDETLNIVHKYLSKLPINIIASKMNNGFARGNNIGIQKAIDDGCDLIFILNPDMQLERECLNALTQRIISDEKIGVIGPIVLDRDNPGNFIQSYGMKVNFKTQKKDIFFAGKKLSNEIPHENCVDYMLGGAMMIRSSVLETTGLFEEDYFMYNDELDFAYRINKAGYKYLCLRDAIVRHYHDFTKSNRKGNNLMYYYIMRNKYLYFFKYRLITNLIFSLIKEVIIIPLKIRWAIRRMGDIRILKFYYLGILDGLLRKKGLANKLFD